MADLGDLREGYWDKDEMADVAVKVENEMPNLELAGVGTNVGCYGSLLPTTEKLEELVDVAEKIEARIGRRLEYISGGATSSFMNGLLDSDDVDMFLTEITLREAFKKEKETMEKRLLLN